MQVTNNIMSDSHTIGENGKFGLIGFIMGTVKGVLVSIASALPTLEAVIQTAILALVGSLVSIAVGFVKKKITKKGKE